MNNEQQTMNEIQEKSITTSQFARLWDMGLDLTTDTPARPNEPVAQIEWVYACLMLIIRTCRNLQLVLSTAADEIVESGPVYDFLFNNDDLPWMDFITQTVGYLAIHNQVYWITMDLEGIKPRQIIIAGRDTCRPVLRRGVLVGYELKVAEGRRVPLFLEDVYPLIDFNPYSRHQGIGPLDSAKLAISTSYQATLLNESTLANGARIGTILTVPAGVKLDQDQIDKMKAEFRSQYAGARKAGQVFLATGGVDVKPFTQTMADLQMLDLRRFDAASICAAFGVPTELVGLNPEAQYAHGPAQQRFIQNTVAPMLSFISGHLTLGILKRFRFDKTAGVGLNISKTFCGSRLPLRLRSCYRREKLKAIQSQAPLFAWFDLSAHPALQELQRSTAESCLKFTQFGVPLNDLIEAHDLPYQTQAWGDDWWIAMGQVPARFTLEAGIEGITGPSLPEGEEENPEPKADDGRRTKDDNPSAISAVSAVKDDEPHRLRLWRSWVVTWIGIEKEYSTSLRVFFVRQQRILVKKLAQALSVSAGTITNSDGRETRDERRETNDDIIARVVFDLKAENGKLTVINHTYFGKASELGIRQALTEAAGLKGEDLNKRTAEVKLRPAIKRLLQISSRRITGVNKTTQDMVANQLKAGLEAGEGLSELTTRIKDVLGSNRQRALGIARTQTSGAVSTGRHEGFRSSGIELKSWLSARDTHVRKSHLEAESKYAAGIPVDSFFELTGGRVMFPCDPSGPAGEIINCRCVELASKSGGKDYDLTMQFYSYSDMQRDIALESKEASNATT
jgi:HK97 family phage portal protein